MITLCPTFRRRSLACKMPLLYTGRRRTKLDHSYNGPPRQGPVRHISPAQLNLERVYEQNRLNSQRRNAAKVPEPAPGPAAKGKPRLLLMGQRR
jgi:Ras-related GTP-binding protein C/D